MPCKYNGNVCGLLGNADQDPTNDNVMPNGEIASSDAELGDSWLVNSFPDFLNLNTAQCEPGVSVTDVEPECPAMDLRSAANVCKMIIDPRLAYLKDLPKITVEKIRGRVQVFFLILITMYHLSIRLVTYPYDRNQT